MIACLCGAPIAWVFKSSTDRTTVCLNPLWCGRLTVEPALPTLHQIERFAGRATFTVRAWLP